MMVRPVLTVVILACSTALGQNSFPVHSKQPPTTENKATKDTPASHPWLEKASQYAAELDRDVQQLSTSEAALVNAQMARTWWKLDAGRSRQLLDRAIALVTHVPDNESKEDRQQRVAAGFQVVSIATPMVSSEEIKQVTAELSKGAADPNPMFNAKMQEQRAFTRAVSNEAFRGDPNVAVKMMLDALKDGRGLSGQMIHELRYRDEGLANRVFVEALKALPALNYDWLTVGSLIMDAFPPTEAAKSAPEDLKKALLQVVAEAVLRVPQNDDDRRVICNNMTIVMQFLPGKFPPDTWAAIQGVADGCLHKPGEAPKVSYPKPPVDCFKVGAQECLRLAETETEPRERSDLRFNAMSAATSEDNPELAISIYKSMTEEERKQEPLMFLQLSDPYDKLGQKYLKNNDRTAFYNMLRDAPDELRVDLQLTFADEMLEKESTPEGLALLAEGRAALAKNGSPYTYLYLQLLNTYAKRQAGEAPAVMRECIEGLNGISYPKDDLEARRRGMSRGMRPWGVSPKLMDQDAAFLSASADALQSPQWRACFRMGLLQAALRRNQMESLEKKAVESKPATAK